MSYKSSSATKWVIGGILFIAIVVIGYFSLNNSGKSSTTPIKIGVIAPMTGNLAFMGEGIKSAILLAQENVGPKKHTYQVIFEDDQLDAKMSASAANKLIGVDKVDALISFSSGTGNVVSPIAEQNKIVHISIATDPNVAKGSYNFIHWTPPTEENKVFVAELQHRGIKKLGVFESNTQGAAAIMADMREKLQGTGIEIVTDQVFNMGEKDFRGSIAKVKNSGAEIYLLLAYSPELEILGKQLKEADINTPLTSIESFELSEQVALFEGDWYINAADPTSAFTNAFVAKTSKTPTLGAPNAYDSFNLIVTATEKITGTTKPTPERIANELSKITNFSGALGTLSINADGVVLSKAAVRMIKDGKPVTVSN